MCAHMPVSTGWSSGMVLRIPRASKSSIEQLFAIIGFAQIVNTHSQTQTPSTRDSVMQTKLANNLSGYFAILAKVSSSLTLSPTHSLTHSLIHSLTLTYSLTQSLTHGMYVAF